MARVVSRSACRPLAPVRPVSDSPVPQHCYFPIFASVLLMCGEMLSRRSPSPTPSPRGDPDLNPSTPPHPAGGTPWSSQQNSRDSIRLLGPLIPSFPTGFRWKELCNLFFLVSIQRQFHAVSSSLCCGEGENRH